AVAVKECEDAARRVEVRVPDRSCFEGFVVIIFFRDFLARTLPIVRILFVKPLYIINGCGKRAVRRKRSKSGIDEFFHIRFKERGGEHSAVRSEEHTSELQSRENLVCR